MLNGSGSIPFFFSNLCIELIRGEHTDAIDALLVPALHRGQEGGGRQQHVKPVVAVGPVGLGRLLPADTHLDKGRPVVADVNPCDLKRRKNWNSAFHK